MVFSFFEAPSTVFLISLFKKSTESPWSRSSTCLGCPWPGREMMITAQTFSVLWPFLLNKKKTKICSTFRSSTVLERLVLWISGTASKKHMGTRNAKKRTGGFLTLACYFVGQWLCQTTVCALRQSPTSHCGKPAQCKGLNALREWKSKLHNHKKLQILYPKVSL